MRLLPYCPDGVEFYPKQDAVDFEHPGSLVRVPFGVHRFTGRRYPFLMAAGSGDRLMPVARSVAASVAWLATIKRVSVPGREGMGLPDDTRPAATHTYPSNTSSAALAASSVTIHQWCQQHDPLAVIGRYVALDRREWGVVRSAGITPMGKILIRRFGSMHRMGRCRLLVVPRVAARRVAF